VRLVENDGLPHHAAAEAALRGAFGLPLGQSVGEVIDPAHVHQLLERELRLVPQRGADIDEIALVGDFERDLAATRRNARDPLAEPSRNPAGQCLVEFTHYRAIVLVRRIFFCSCRSPYSSTSADGGQPGTYTSTGTMRSQPRTTE